MKATIQKMVAFLFILDKSLSYMILYNKGDFMATSKAKLKTGGYNEAFNKRTMLKQFGTQMQDYLNQIEMILCKPMTDEEKIQVINQVSYLFGKITVAFMQVAEYSDMFQEFNSKGFLVKEEGIHRGRRPKELKKEDMYDFEEVK